MEAQTPRSTRRHSADSTLPLNRRMLETPPPHSSRSGKTAPGLSAGISAGISALQSTNLYRGPEANFTEAGLR
ncbi:hypothetical protein EMPG_09931 [Blastomyces silverae]|uniref:Uncharacterized protein n=1 Tax=Blastomyces silverae TaxID=2060906 RepID=A0A0H1BES4_9EURO|nr:hypothetical protein EMPG_09931 [Blastomyces silverae]